MGGGQEKINFPFQFAKYCVNISSRGKLDVLNHNTVSTKGSFGAAKPPDFFMTRGGGKSEKVDDVIYGRPLKFSFEILGNCEIEQKTDDLTFVSENSYCPVGLQF